LIRKLLHGLLICSLLSGCGASFTYHNLDWLIPWYVEGYVDLSRDQKKSLQAQLEPLLVWHREEELLSYVEILDGIEAGLGSPVTAAQVDSWGKEIVAAFERTELSMLRLGLEFGVQLSDAQVQEFVASLWERQRDFEEEFLERTDEEYTEDQFENLSDFLKTLLGRLSPAQQARVQSAVDQLCRFDSLWVADGNAWLEELENLLQRQPGWQAEVEKAYVGRKEQRDPEFQACFTRNTGLISTAVADVLNDASEKQRTHLFKEIGKLRSRILKLT